MACSIVRSTNELGSPIDLECFLGGSKSGLAANFLKIYKSTCQRYSGDELSRPHRPYVQIGFVSQSAIFKTAADLS
jgi:hypothetical protein